MKKLLTFLTLLTLFFTTAWAATETFNYTGNLQAVKTQNGITITVSKGNGSTDPATNTYSGSHFRIYKGNIVEVNAGNNIINSVTFTFDGNSYTIRANSSSYPNNAILSAGSYTTVGQWTGINTNVATLENGDRTARVTQIVVDYTVSTSNVGVPTISFGSFEEGNTTISATITPGSNSTTTYYKIGEDGDYTATNGTENISLTSNESPITVYAYSSDGAANSAVTSSTFTLPNLGVSIIPDGYSGYDAQNVTISASDYVGTATLTYKINDGEEQVYAPFSLTEPGTYTVTAYAVDQRAGGEKISATATFTISTQASGSTATATYIFNTDQGLADLNITKPDNSSATNISEGEYTVGQVTLTTTDGSTETRVWAGTSGQTDLRVYNGGTLTFSVPEGCTINNIEFTGLNLGKLTGTGYNNGTWVGSAEEVTLSATGTATIYTITVTYTTSQTTTTEEYYLVGDFGGQSWPLLDDYKFTAQGNGIYVLNKVLPDMDNTENFRFKIAKVVDGQRVQPDFGGGGNGDYGLNKKWNNISDIVLGNDNDHQQAFSLPDCFQANFTLNANNMTFSVDKPQLYMIGTFNSYATPNNNSVNGALEMTPGTQNGDWTITHEFTNGTEFRLYDAWHEHHGGNGAHILESLLGTWLNINNDNDNYSIFHFVLDGEYIINVKNDMSQLVATIVPESHNITCTAISDVEDGQGGYKPGGVVTAKVDGTEVTSAMAGSTVTLDIAASTGYTFSSVTLNGSAIDPVQGVYSFTMPNSDATVVANFTVNHYNITLSNDDTQGSVSGLPETAYTGQTVSFSITPEEGYTVKSVTVTPGSVAVTENEGTYSFGMPPFDVTVAVTYNAPLQPCVIPFLESWNNTEGTGGHTGGTGTSSGTVVSDNEGWIYWKGGDTFTEFNGFAGDNCIRIGERDVNGAATTPNIIVSNGNVYKMEFAVVSWNTETESILLSANGATLFADEACSTPISSQSISSSWTTYTVYVKATSNLMNITWEAVAGRNRFFLDGVHITLFEEATITETTLKNLIQTGTPGKLYKISDVDGLLGVYKKGTSVWFKDEVQAVDYQNPTPTTGTYQYYTVVEKKLGINKSEKDFAQNNWIEVVFPSEQDFTNKYVKNLTGTYSCENGNPKLTLTVAVDEENDVITEVPSSGLAYELNPYMAVNFAGNQTYTNNGESQTFFFSQPKAQEYAQILWAVWDGSKFKMTDDSDDNYYGFTGSFTINPELNAYSISGLKTNDSYNFKAIIRKSASKAGPYEVYPTDLNPDVPTAINGVVVNGLVKSVKYVNVAGMVSDVPFQGVNIVVTEYSDGSRSTSKMLRK